MKEMFKKEVDYIVDFFINGFGILKGFGVWGVEMKFEKCMCRVRWYLGDNLGGMRKFGVFCGNCRNIMSLILVELSYLVLIKM